MYVAPHLNQSLSSWRASERARPRMLWTPAPTAYCTHRLPGRRSPSIGTPRTLPATRPPPSRSSLLPRPPPSPRLPPSSAPRPSRRRGPCCRCARQGERRSAWPSAGRWRAWWRTLLLRHHGEHALISAFRVTGASLVHAPACCPQLLADSTAPPAAGPTHNCKPGLLTYTHSQG